jgi:hypothetical protein
VVFQHGKVSVLLEFKSTGLWIMDNNAFRSWHISSASSAILTDTFVVFLSGGIRPVTSIGQALSTP